MALVQISSALGLAKGTLHGLLSTLQGVGFVRQTHSGGPYLVTEDLAALGRDRLDPYELRAHALNWSDALAARSGEAVKVAVFREGRAVVAHHVFGADAGRQVMATGSVVPLHASALGKVLLAFDPSAGRFIVGRDLPSLTFRTVTDRRTLTKELAAVRDNGWASAVDEDVVGHAGLAAPIRDRGGYVIAVVGIEGATARLCDERGRPRPALIAHVTRAGREISRELGHGRSW